MFTDGAQVPRLGLSWGNRIGDLCKNEALWGEGREIKLQKGELEDKLS